MNNSDGCTRCGTFVRGPNRLFTEAGDRVCPACLERDQDQTNARNAEDAVLLRAYGALPLAFSGAFIALFVTRIGHPMLAFASVMAGRALEELVSSAKLREGVGAHLGPACVCAVLSLAIAAIKIVLWLLEVVFASPS